VAVAQPPGVHRPRRRQRSGGAAGGGGARARAPRQLAIIEAGCAGAGGAGSGGRGRHRGATAAAAARVAHLRFPSLFPCAPRRSSGALPGERGTRWRWRTEDVTILWLCLDGFKVCVKFL
jgi:hypothetical protein